MIKCLFSSQKFKEDQGQYLGNDNNIHEILLLLSQKFEEKYSSDGQLIQHENLVASSTLFVCFSGCKHFYRYRYHSKMLTKTLRATVSHIPSVSSAIIAMVTSVKQSIRYSGPAVSLKYGKTATEWCSASLQLS